MEYRREAIGQREPIHGDREGEWSEKQCTQIRTGVEDSGEITEYAMMKPVRSDVSLDLTGVLRFMRGRRC